MPEAPLPIFQIQDFNTRLQQERYFYLKPFSQHLQEHDFIQKPHKHDFYILLFITRGTGTHTIDFETYPVKPNTVFFLTPGQVHNWQLTPDTEGYILFFNPAYYLLDFPHHKLQNFPFFQNLLHKPFLILSDADLLKLESIIKSMEQELRQQQAYTNAIIRNYLDILLLQLTRLYQTEKQEKQLPAGMHSQLEQLENLIDAHYKEHLPVSYYAQQLNVSAKQLNEICKRAIGQTTTELIQNRIILEAQRLLAYADLTVTQVAAELGYFDATYFFRFFKKKVGQTPEQFKNSQLYLS
ncbi:AraC family transcriptional regulator [Pontibacter vulgaris]|uniref:AraC family transcriptional regulator n=1 Tax=Pontibacter vulgaris TaxID=2905679 RepID=UPI001FA771DE|nr:helix-turn-helix domain-containing protein [Pontibacter vulgaris]